jgi:SIR2-like protein
MTINLSVILPNVAQTLNGTGFLFGAGASYEAGYPLMPVLTQNVISGLTPDHRTLLDEVLHAQGSSYNSSNGIPNIEQIADFIIAHWTNSGDPRFSALETRLRELILECLLSVSSPNLDYHVQFLSALKKRAFGLPCCVWILTTNYDLLFEQAAALCGVEIENGFCGTTHRFFNAAQLRNCSGSVAGQHFTQSSNLTIKLLKLHGSISWFEQDGRFFEQHPLALVATARRAMVLPRRRKLMETLTPPYDSLFTEAVRVLGGECRYLASCGFNYADEHITQHVLMPAMQAKKCRLFALSQLEPDGLTPFASMPNYSGAFKTHSHSLGARTVETTDIWKFSNFVKLFE